MYDNFPLDLSLLQKSPVYLNIKKNLLTLLLIISLTLTLV